MPVGSLHGHADLGARYLGEALGLAEVMANEGNEEMADMIARSGDVLPARAVEAARSLREAFKARRTG